MLSVVASVWNEIARTQILQTDWAKEAFCLDQQGINDFHSRECERLQAQHLDLDVILAYLDLRPLLIENVAITNFVLMVGDLDLRQALPEVVTVDEAVILGSADRCLSQSQAKQLRDLLCGPLKA
ncbi:hypothetical protein [Geomonas anaerohicana]|uniref:Uncharacterized protein n=1 Tax=Geomonas anaerohicana TaxID=2798583 RepID=A0ABS0YGU0_9BACT|nr:hypothetical protein [Geomonas anaerohicana]MBJ6751349.1 hypothetical protein [Geomonas anaerohicana]